MLTKFEVTQAAIRSADARPAPNPDHYDWEHRGWKREAPDLYPRFIEYKAAGLAESCSLLSEQDLEILGTFDNVFKARWDARVQAVMKAKFGEDWYQRAHRNAQ